MMRKILLIALAAISAVTVSAPVAAHGGGYITYDYSRGGNYRDDYRDDRGYRDDYYYRDSYRPRYRDRGYRDGRRYRSYGYDGRRSARNCRSRDRY
jgi:hypothetical protein